MKRLFFITAFMVMAVFSFAASTPDITQGSSDHSSSMVETQLHYSPIHAAPTMLPLVENEEGKRCKLTIETRREDGTWQVQRIVIDGVTCMELVEFLVRAIL